MTDCYCDRLRNGRRCRYCDERRQRRVDLVLFGSPFAIAALGVVGAWLWHPLAVAAGVAAAVWLVAMTVMALGAFIGMMGG